MQQHRTVTFSDSGCECSLAMINMANCAHIHMRFISGKHLNNDDCH